MKNLMIVLSVVYWCVGIWLFTVFNVNAQTGQWKAVWTANTETDLAGYFLYWRTAEGVYNETDKVWVLNSQRLITGLVPDMNYICVTAHDTLMNESECSIEVLFDHNMPPLSAPTGLTIVEVVP